MVYLKYNSVKLPVLDNYNIAKSSQEITFSDLKCDFTGHQKADLPEKYQEVRVVEESKVNREIEKIEYEEKKDVKELSFESKVKEKISICKVHGYSSQETREESKSTVTGAKVTVNDTYINNQTKFNIDGNSYQETTEGKNLINPFSKYSAGYSTTVNGVTFTLLEDGKIRVNGTATGGRAAFAFFIPDTTVKAGNYILSRGSEKVQVEAKIGDTYYRVAGSSSNVSIVEAQKIFYVALIVNEGLTVNNEVVYAQLEDGTVATEYEQYGTMPSEKFPSAIKNVDENIEIDICNKNLLSNKIEDYDISSGLYGYRKIVGELRKKYLVLTITDRDTSININEVYFGFTGNGKNGDEEKAWIVQKGSILGSLAGNKRYISTQNFKYFSFYPNNKETFNKIFNRFNIEVELSDESSPSNFITHESKNLVFPLTQDQKLMQGDYLADDGIHHTKTQIQLDGITRGLKVESVTKHSNDIYYCVIKIIKQGVNGTNNMYSTHFTPYFGVKTGSCYITGYGGFIVLVLTDQSITTVDAANTWLAAQKEKGTPVMIEYELAQEVVEPYTVEQQKAWNNMQNLVSYVGINNINSSTNIDVKYPVRIKKEIVPETYDKLLYTGYIEDYVFDKMRELDIDTSINFTLMTPKKITTLRTCIAVGTYQLKDLIENIILAPLIDDGFILKTLEITDRKITVNYLCKTIEYCLNNLSNKFNFWWYIDENKNIYFKDIELLYSEDNIEHVYDDENKISGLEYIKPTVNSENYANVVNFTNVRIYEQSHMSFNGKDIVESYNPILEQQISTLKQNEQIDFLFPLDVKKENIIKSAESTSLYNNLLYGVYISGKYSDNTTFTVYYGYNKSIKSEIKTNNVGYEGNNADNEKEFLLIRDSFFNNLITGFRYNGTKVIKEIMEIKSDSALIWNIYKFYNDKGIEEKKDKISKTGIVETTINMNESWKTIQELEDIGASYIDKNSLKFDGQIELKADQNVFNVGERVRINKHMGDLLIDGTYIITEVQELFSNNEFEYIAICKNSNMLSNFIDTFRGEDTQESSEKTYKLYVTHYNEEQILESHEVVQ